MGIDDTVFCDLANPKMKGDRGGLDVFDESSVCLDQDILNNVAHVDPLSQPLVEPHGDHPAQRIPMSVEEFFDRLRFALSDIDQKFCSCLALGPD
jgi:hypothetical protein